MAKKRKLTEGWLCRDNEESDSYIVLILGPQPIKKKTPFGMQWRPVNGSVRDVWNAEEFRKLYGFTPRIGSCELYDVEL